MSDTDPPSDPPSDDEVHPTQEVDNTEATIYEQIKSKLGGLDKKSFEIELYNIYKDDEHGLNEIRCSMYDFAKSEKDNFPDGNLIKRVRRGSGVCVVRKYAADIYCLYNFIEGGINSSTLQQQVMSKSKSRLRMSDFTGNAQSGLEENDNTTRNPTDSVIEPGSPLREEDVNTLVLILSNVQELKQVIHETNSDIQSRLEKTESKYDKELSELKALCKQKSAKIETLENVVDEMRDRECKLKSEIKLLKQQEKSNTTHQEQTKKLLHDAVSSLQLKLNSLESKLTSLNTKLHDLQRDSRCPATPVQIVPQRQQNVPDSGATPRAEHSPPQNYAEAATATKATSSTSGPNNSVFRTRDTGPSKETNDQTRAVHESMRIRTVVTRDMHDNHDLFSGVSRPSIKRVALTNVYLDRSVEDITNGIYKHAENHGINLTFVRHISTRETRYGETAIFRINVQVADYERILEEGFWPDRVKCKDWFSPAQRDAFKQERNSYQRYGHNDYYPSETNYTSEFNRSYTRRWQQQSLHKDAPYRNRFDALDS